MFTKTLAKTLFAASIAVAASAAMADAPTIVVDNFQPQLSRAEVQAQVLQARANGALSKDDESASARSQLATSNSVASRDSVRAELRTAPRMPVSYNPAA